MKYLKCLLTVLCIAIAPIMTSCDKNDDDKPTTVSILGSWQQTNDYGTVITLTFNKDTSGSVLFQYANGDSAHEKFSYEFVDYMGAERWITIIGSSLEGEFDVVLTATRLRLSYYSNGADHYLDFTRI